MSGLRSVTTAIAVLFLATPLIAQSAATVQDTTTLAASTASSSATKSVNVDVTPATTAPAWINALGVAPVNAPRMAAVRSADYEHSSESTAMMIVGGAGLLVGAIIGGKAGTVIMVGGGVVGLAGLWGYLK